MVTVESFVETFAPIFHEEWSKHAAKDYEFFTEDMFLTPDEMLAALRRPFSCEHGKPEVHNCMTCGPQLLLIAQIQKILLRRTGRTMSEEDADTFGADIWERYATKE